MDRVEFVQLREALTTNLPPASDAQLQEAASKLRRRLESSVMFAGVEVEVTEDPDRLLVALVRFRPGTRERQVASFLEAVWITELRLSGLDVFNFHIELGHVELEAATGDPGSGYFLSLQLIAVEGYAQDFEGKEAGQDDRHDGGSPTSQPPAEGDSSGGRKWFRKKS